VQLHPGDETVNLPRNLAAIAGLALLAGAHPVHADIVSDNLDPIR